MFSSENGSELTQSELLPILISSDLNLKITKSEINTSCGVRKSTTVTLMGREISDYDYDTFRDLRTNCEGHFKTNGKSVKITETRKLAWPSFRVVHINEPV